MSYTGCTLIPGLIDSHVHLFMSGTQNLDARKKQLEAGFDTVRDDITRRLKKYLSHGVIAVRDGADRYGHTRQP
ncbi:MAG: amidohydrolase family protein [Deltaproteobacteria bacterium]|nr:amidohydrolase family protein [Deltaproteobacteria bacterium]